MKHVGQLNAQIADWLQVGPCPRVAMRELTAAGTSPGRGSLCPGPAEAREQAPARRVFGSGVWKPTCARTETCADTLQHLFHAMAEDRQRDRGRRRIAPHTGPEDRGRCRAPAAGVLRYQSRGAGHVYHIREPVVHGSRDRYGEEKGREA